MFARRSIGRAWLTPALCALALAGCAAPFGETPAMCRATIDVARGVSEASHGARVVFAEQDGAVVCEAEANAQSICAAYQAQPPGAGLAPIGAAFRSCLLGHGYVRNVHRREQGGETLIDAMPGGFRFHVTLDLNLDDAGRRYEIRLDQRVFLTEARPFPTAS